MHCPSGNLLPTDFAGETALGQAVAGGNGALGGVLNAGFNAANSLVYAGEHFVNTVSGVPVPDGFHSCLSAGRRRAKPNSAVSRARSLKNSCWRPT